MKKKNSSNRSNNKGRSKRVWGILMAATMSLSALIGCGSTETATSAPEIFPENYQSNIPAEVPAGATDDGDYHISDSISVDVTGESEKRTDVEAMEDMALNSAADVFNCWDAECIPGVEWDDGSPLDGETYKALEENGFQSVVQEPLSTFAADVDSASYANLRRMIRDGYGLGEIPADAVRIEEMINYFTYDLPTPKKDIPFAVTAEMGQCPWNEQNQLLMVGMRTAEIDLSEAPASNLVFLIDVSGSMQDEDKLPLLQDSFCMLAEGLREQDRISIVTYAGSDEVVLEGAKGSDYKAISDALNNLYASGSTNGSDGINTAYEIAEKYFIDDGNNRVLLATDGDLNVGITTESGLEKLIEEKKESGVYLSVLGFGTGNINDVNMETLADKGNGNYAYIDSAFEANRVLVQQLGATLYTVAKDVKLQVEFNPALVEGYRLLGYENRVMAAQDFNDDTKDGGEIGAGHCVVALYEVVPVGAGGITLRYQDEEETKQDSSKYGDEYCAVSIRYKEPDSDESTLLTYPIDTDANLDKTSQEFAFAACVAEAGLILSDSEYKADADLKAVLKRLEKMNLKDESRQEFLYLMEELEDESSGQ